MTTDTRTYDMDEGSLVTAAIAGDESAFTTLTRRYRRELHVHCYRMLASFEDAEDLVQETFLKAWQRRETYHGRASFRAWLYRIATNACLDFLEKKERRVVEIPLTGASPDTANVIPHVAWLQPYPDRLLDRAASGDSEPDTVLVRKETIELAFLVAMQLLPPRQRAALILCDVLDWSANEAAALLESSVASVNGALQRARDTLRRFRPVRDAQRPAPAESSDEEQALLRRYIELTERNDAHGIAELLRQDVQFTMPPEPVAFKGRDAVVGSWVQGGFGSPPYNDWKHVVTRANGLPAVVFYLRRPDGDHYHPFAMDVLRLEHGEVAEITTFDAKPLVGAFDLPETIP
ncbi:MAG TPA: RNA polymerase subunit sigma-70 [Gemmatimonadaceae bacterium]|jgi:RNA polymerase sigma-70 factor (ECF subfamily)|nr:RNA polymerase subunit sigma-70 [Gemmatimonadaceae bacterium]